METVATVFFLASQYLVIGLSSVLNGIEWLVDWAVPPDAQRSVAIGLGLGAGVIGTWKSWVFLRKKYFNAFTRFYSGIFLPRILFIFEGLLLSVLWIVSGLAIMSTMADSPSFFSVLMLIIVCGALIFALEQKLCPRPANALRIKPLRSWDILYLYLLEHDADSKHSGYSCRPRGKRMQRLLERIGASARVDEPDHEPLLLSEIRVGRPFADEKTWWLPRYHESFGMVPYVGFFARFILSPFVPILIIFFVGGAVEYTAPGEFTQLIAAYEWFQRVIDAFFALFAFAFGPAFAPLNSFEGVTQNGVETSLVLSAEMQLLARAAFIVIIFCCFFPQYTGHVFIVALTIYSVQWIAFIGYFAFLSEKTYFAVVMDSAESNIEDIIRILVDARHLSGLTFGALSENDIVDAIMSRSGFADARSSFENGTPELFFALCMPGFVFWVYSVIRILLALRTVAGRVTYFDQLLIPQLRMTRFEWAEMRAARQGSAPQANEATPKS